MTGANVRWWLRSLGIGALVGLLSGFVIGGVLGRVFMRLLFLAEKDTRGIETAMDAVIGDFTAGGTLFIFLFGAQFGLLVGVAYVACRMLLPSRPWRRELWFVLAVSGLLLGFLIRFNREDFVILPVTLSVLLLSGSIVATALPVPFLVERFAPDRERHPGRATRGVLGVGSVAIAVYAITGIAIAYTA